MPPLETAIARGDAAEAKLIALLPTPLKALRCLTGSTAVYRLTLKLTAQALTARNDDKLPLPEPLRTELKALQTRVLDETGIALAPLAGEVSADGRPRLRLKPSNVQWIDPASARPSGDGRPPPALANSLPKTGAWQAKTDGPNLLLLAQLGADEEVQADPSEPDHNACLLNGTCRHLTSGEILLADSVFISGTIDYARARVYYHPYVGPQGEFGFIAPNGAIYPGRGYPKHSDFSQVSLNRQALFIHELVHVWQHQQGIDVKSEGFKLHIKSKILRFDPYDYLPFDPNKKFENLNIEQQGQMVEDYFLLTHNSVINSLHNVGQTALPISVNRKYIKIVK